LTLKDSQRYEEAVEYFSKAAEAVPNYGLAHWGLAWSAFGQIKSGCPCTPEDEALVVLIVDHSAKALEYGANDPGLTERAEILGKGEKIK
jgi:tetratricopeptide (TPR) repeat protein